MDMSMYTSAEKSVFVFHHLLNAYKHSEIFGQKWFNKIPIWLIDKWWASQLDKC